MSERRDVVVVGGGLAGITAALDCAQAGARVTLVEVRRRLGGAAYSVERDGLTMDNGQHVFLRGCLAYRGLLARLGSESHTAIQPRLRIPVLAPGAKPFTLQRGRLPAPLHLTGAILRYPHLSLIQRLAAARAALALMRLGERELEADAVTFGEWLAEHGQGREAIAALWDLIALPTLNLPARQASLALGAFVFRRGLLQRADAGDIGFHVGTLEQIIGAPAAAALARAGVDVRLGWRAQALERDGGVLRLRGQAGDTEDEIAADAVVVALPHARAGTLLEPLLGEPARRLQELGGSPIVNLHVVYDRVVCDEPFAAGVRTPVQYLFDRSAAGGATAGSQYLAVSLSGAEEEMKLSVDALRERYEPALEQLLPRARHARIETFLVTREHAATFRAVPGVAAFRLGARTAVPGLVLAGTWTAAGWPATLESAVISGHSAAAVALADAGVQHAPAAGAGVAAGLAG